MTDELQVQQTSKTPYVVTTGIIGAGAGAALGAAKKPGWAREASPYTTYEQLVNEKKDTFEDAAKGKEQSIVDKAKEAQAALEKYDADYEAYKEANKGGVAPTELPKDDPLLAKQAEAQKALDTAKADYDKALNDKIAELKKAEGEKTVTKVVEGKPNNSKALLDKIKATQAELADMRQVNAEVKAKVEPELLAKLQDMAVKLSGVSGKEAAAIDKEITSELERLVNLYFYGDKAKVKELKQLVMDSAQKLDLPAGAFKTTEAVLKKVNPEKLEIFAQGADRRVANLTRLNELFEKYMADSIPQERKLIVTRIVEGTSDGKPIKLIEREYAPEEVKEIKSFFDTLTAEDKTLFKTYIGKDETDAVKLADEIAKYKKMAQDYRTAATTIEQTTATKIPAVEIPDNPQIAKKQGYLDGLIKTRDGGAREIVEHTIGLNDEQIAEKAKKAVSDAAVKEKQGVLDGIKKDIEKAISELPKAAAKEEKDLIAEFEKANGTKASIIEKLGKDISKDAGKIKGGKLAWIIGAGALAGVILGAIIAPKNKA